MSSWHVEVVRAGIRKLSADTREQRISVAYEQAYTQVPLTEDEMLMLDSAGGLVAELPL
jgi:hypothetical protein